jgi:hypothetical protein
MAWRFSQFSKWHLAPRTLKAGWRGWLAPLSPRAHTVVGCVSSRVWLELDITAYEGHCRHD